MWRFVDGPCATDAECSVSSLSDGAAYAAARQNSVIDAASRLQTSPQRFLGWEKRQDWLTARRDRLEGEPAASMIRSSFGVTEPLSWRGAACSKSAFDMALYAMLLQELRPRTIIELGAGQGGSAAFLADLSRAFGLEARIVAVDKVAVARKEEDVSFVHADCVEWLENAALRRERLPRPLLVIEDFHVDLSRFFPSLDSLLLPGDYLVVEDAITKQDQLERALRGRSYAVDARYTDFFGVNCTSATNGVLKKLDYP